MTKRREPVWFVPSEVTKRRLVRNAEAKAKRYTPEWYEGGRQLLAERAAAEEDARKRADDPFHGSDDEWELLTWEVSPRTLDKYTRMFERAVTEVAADSGMEADVIAADVLDAFLATEVIVRLKGEAATRRRIALGLELLRTQFAYDVSEGMAKLRRNHR